jgi:hypothetical protein
MRAVELLGQTALVSALAGACLAQSGPSTTVVRAGQFAAGASNVWFSAAPAMMMAPQGAPGMPFSAEMVSEHKQTLGDGTNITETHVQSKIYHDSQGRTRTEQFLQFPGKTAELPAFIQISDPVAGYIYTLDPQRHTVRKMAFRPASAFSNRVMSANIVPADRMALPTKMMATNMIAEAPTAHVQAAQAGLAAPANTNNPSPRPEVSSESLGTQNIEGVQAAGTRTTVTYPEGFFGNDRPLKTINESWTSPELKMTVLTTSSDPRYGESTTRLTNIVQAEPDPSLFEIPSDYQESDAGAMGGGISFDARSASVK